MSKLLSIILICLYLFIPNANAASTYYDANSKEVSAEAFAKIKKEWDEKTTPILKAREEAYIKSITRIVTPKVCTTNVCDIKYRKYKSVTQINREKLAAAPTGANFYYWRNVYASRKGEYGNYKGLGQSFKTPGTRFVRKNNWLSSHGYSISLYPAGTVNGIKRYNYVIDLPCMYINTARPPCKRRTFNRRTERGSRAVKRYPHYNIRMNDNLMRRQVKHNVYQKQLQSVWPWEQK